MVIKSDEFNGTSLDTNVWSIINPKNDATLSVTNGTLSISVPYGVSHDLWSTNYAPRVTQVYDNTDFEIEIKFNSIPKVQYQHQGIVVEQNNTNFIRFDFVHNGDYLSAFSAVIANGIGSSKIVFYINPGLTTLYMNVKRIGDQWIQKYSTDGITWIDVVTFTQSITASKIGIFGGNHGVPETVSPQFTALVDYFRVLYPIPPPPPPPPPPVTSPVAHWAFEESSGSIIIDSSPNGNNGIIYGGTTRTTGVVGNAIQFDGIDGSYAQVTTNLLPSGLSPRSISAWINVLEYTPESFIFFYGSGSEKNAFYITLSGAEVRGGAWDSILGDIVYPDFFKILNKWYHVCLTYDGTTAILYGMGMELGRKFAPDWNLIQRPNGGYINVDYGNRSPLKVKIDEIKVFGKTLTLSEVQQEANIIPTTCDPLNCTLNIL